MSTSFPHALLAVTIVSVLAMFMMLGLAHRVRRREQRLPAATAFEHVEALLDERRADLIKVDAELRDKLTAAAQCDIALADFQVYQDRVITLRQELESMDPLRRELDEVSRALAGLREDLVTSRQQKEALESQRLDLARTLAKGRDDVDALAEEREALEGVTESLTLHRNGLRAEIDETERRLQQCRADASQEQDALKTARDDHQTLTERANAVRAELAGLESAVIPLRQQHDGLTERIGTLESRRDKLDEANREAEAREGVTTARLARLDEQVIQAEQALKAARDDHQTLTERTNAVRAELAGLEATKETLHAWMKGIQAPKDGAEIGSLDELLRPPACFASFPVSAGKSIDEHTALERVEKHLDHLGLRFPRRALQAFHTCLKIADISPLTVLAGISGTGKSQLPRRYAEAVGMHFLPLSVQPRWDSPQDLFGFYNYLEQRYKATELARAMVHLDGGGWPEQAQMNKDRVVLALLDEMNLARVEYYFSEFLSKLEMRYGDGDRTAAAIDLDLGRLPEESSPRRVYPVENILFVGTMNEDESTQTLSDKVVDRANVFRFTRPAALATRQDDTSVKGHPAEGYLPLSVWRSWHKPETNDGKVRERITKLNEALDRLGRPFGHRTYQAMLAYIGNHPGATDDSGRKRAFADQLELRIFPKLRGVEPDLASGALDGIRRLLDDLGDEKLASAFAEARKTDLFVWSGVRREAGA